MMKIKLVRTGGIIPIRKIAEADIELSEQELTDLLGTIESSPSAPRIKDGNYWEIRVGEKATPIDPEKVPEEYKSLFDKLKGELKIVKQGNG
jgi:hypothetical protein